MTEIAANTTNAYFPEFVDRVAKLVAGANAWLKALGTTGIQDEETARRANDYIDQVKAELKAIEDERKKQVRPLIDEQNTVNDKAKQVAKPLDVALGMLEPLQRTWLQELRRRQAEEANRKAEEARKAEAEAARLAAEAAKVNTVEAAVAAESAAAKVEETKADLTLALTAKPMVKGDFAARATGLRTIWSGRIDDIGAATLHYLAMPVGKAKILEVVQALANADAKALKRVDLGIPGVTGIAEER